MMISKTFQMRLTVTSVVRSLLVTSIILSGGAAYAASDNSCSQLPSHADLKAALHRCPVVCRRQRRIQPRHVGHHRQPRRRRVRGGLHRR